MKKINNYIQEKLIIGNNLTDNYCDNINEFINKYNLKMYNQYDLHGNYFVFNKNNKISNILNYYENTEELSQEINKMFLNKRDI